MFGRIPIAQQCMRYYFYMMDGSYAIFNNSVKMTLFSSKLFEKEIFCELLCN
jgi:hypothetical protein